MNPMLLALLLFCCNWALADIYVYRAQDGAVSLSNVPTDSRFETLIAAPNALPLAPDSSTPAREKEFDALISATAQSYGLDDALLHAVILAESRFDPGAVSKKGAVGLMQLMPETAARYGVVDAYDPAQNLDGGARYLRDLLGMFGHDLSLALAAYNAGEKAVLRYGNRIPPIRETMNYVPRVLGFYRRYVAKSAPR